MLPYIINIQKYSIHDGDGIRTTVFFKGCPLSCLWCHNPESQSYGKELMFSKEKCQGCLSCENICSQKAVSVIDGKAVTDRENCTLCQGCIDFCVNNAREIVGKQYTVNELFKELFKDSMFYEESGGGVTLSGGEVMSQDIEYVVSLLKKLKLRGINTAVDTCGYAPYENFRKVLPFTDMFLYDVKLIDEALHEKYTGKSNKLILENLKRLSDDGAVINIRIPIVEGVNADDAAINDIVCFLKDNIKVYRVNLLPYHNTGSHKYEKLDQKYSLSSLKAPSKEHMEEIKLKFEHSGFNNVKIGG